MVGYSVLGCRRCLFGIQPLARGARKRLLQGQPSVVPVDSVADVSGRCPRWTRSGRRGHWVHRCRSLRRGRGPKGAGAASESSARRKIPTRKQSAQQSSRPCNIEVRYDGGSAKGLPSIVFLM